MARDLTTLKLPTCGASCSTRKDDLRKPFRPSNRPSPWPLRRRLQPRQRASRSGRMPEALAHIRRGRSRSGPRRRALQPGLSQLRLGDWKRGWPNYESRWRFARFIACRVLQPASLRGEALDGRRILLHAEQGLGDTVQFCRYARSWPRARLHHHAGPTGGRAPSPIPRHRSGRPSSNRDAWRASVRL